MSYMQPRQVFRQESDYPKVICVALLKLEAV